MDHFLKVSKEIVAFGIVGLITFLIDLSVTTILYNTLYFPAYLASGIGFLSAFFFNFPANRKRVFRHTGNDRFSLKTQIILYALLSVFNLVATSMLVQILVTLGVDIVYTKIAVTAAIALWNFLLFKLFIFSKKKTVAPDSKIPL